MFRAFFAALRARFMLDEIIRRKAARIEGQEIAAAVLPAKRKRTNNGAGGRASMQRVQTCACGRTIKGPAFKKHTAKCPAALRAKADAEMLGEPAPSGAIATLTPSQADLAAMAEPKAPPLPLGLPAQL